jgi:hypothetical protein
MSDNRQRLRCVGDTTAAQLPPDMKSAPLWPAVPVKPLADGYATPDLTAKNVAAIRRQLMTGEYVERHARAAETKRAEARVRDRVRFGWGSV